MYYIYQKFGVQNFSEALFIKWWSQFQNRLCSQTIYSLNHRPPGFTPRQLCVQMDFTRTFETTTRCNNINNVWSHFYQILVVLKYHRRLWANNFDTDISKCINTYMWCIWPFSEYLCSYKCLCQRYWLMGVYGTSKLPKFYRTDFKHDLYCCIWWWFEMSA